MRVLAWIIWRTFRWQSGRPPFDEYYEGWLEQRATKTEKQVKHYDR